MDPNMKKRKRHDDTTRGVKCKVYDPSLKIANICATADYKCFQDIDLFQVALHFKNVEYNANFAAVLLRRSDRVQGSMVVLLLFRSGKVNIVGVKSRERALYWLNRLRNELHDALNITYRAPLVMRVSMITCDSTLDAHSNTALDVRSFFDKHIELSIWEPEIFPGLKFSPFDNKITILGFESLKYVITGAKTLDDCHRASLRFRQLATPHLKTLHPNGNCDPLH